MKKKKRKFYLITALILLVVLTLIGVLYYVNNSRTNYTFSERNYINSNSNTMINISVEKDLPVFSYNGEGVFYDFLKDFEKDTTLSFNITVNGEESNYKLSNKNNYSSDDLVLYTDHFVLISSRQSSLSSINTIKGENIGVIKSDKDYIASYLGELDLDYQVYDSFDSLKSDMNNTIIYAIVPMYRYMRDIIYNKYNIIYHFEGLNSYYTLSFSGDDDTFRSISNKFYNKWKSNSRTSVNKNLATLYYQASNMSELQIESVTGNDLIVGYVDNLPYEGKVNNSFSGVTNTYLELFGDLTGATYKYIKYKNVDELIKALNNKKVDIVLNYYNLNNTNYNKSNGMGNINYVVVTYKDNIKNVYNINSLKNENVDIINNTSLYSYVKNAGISTKTFDTYKGMFKNMSKDDTLVIEESTYNYYKNDKLKDYIVRYKGVADTTDTFLFTKANNVLSNIFDFYITTLGINEVSEIAVNNSLEIARSSIVTQFIMDNIIYILALLVALAFLIFKFNRKVKVTKKIKKEDKMMYLDVMTNLKNRNYLNDNLVYWESNKIYPQAIVVIDLNDLAVINDIKGHEEGDKQIRSAANILIRTQRENSEIIRSDGNEFLVYLVGYDEKQIVTYVNKLFKEFKTLPYEYGVSIGYSLITTESTTIDDAINEALIMMRKNKGE